MSAITEKHIAFAKAAVALAREMDIAQVNMTFRMSAARIFGTQEWSSEEITLRWHEGRHGSPSQLQLECRAMMNVPEEVRP